jgi:hypothetical protein
MPWAPDYLELADAKDWLQIEHDNDDAQVAEWISAASRAVDERCSGFRERQFGQLDQAAEFTYDDAAVYDPRSRRWLLEIDDVTNVTGLQINGVAYASQSAVLWPRDAVAKGKAYTALAWPTAPPLPLSATTVTARFGWSVVPPNVIGAVKLQLNRWHTRRGAPFGVAGSPTDGSEIRLSARLDPDVAVNLRGWARAKAVG